MIRYAFCDSEEKKSAFVATLLAYAPDDESLFSLVPLLCDYDRCERLGIPAAFAQGTFVLAKSGGSVTWVREVFDCIEPGIDLNPVVFRFPQELLRDSANVVANWGECEISPSSVPARECAGHLAELIGQVVVLFESDELDLEKWRLMFGKFIGFEQYYSIDSLPQPVNEARLAAICAVSLVVSLMQTGMREALGVKGFSKNSGAAKAFTDICQHASKALEDAAKPTLQQRFLSLLKEHVVRQQLLAV
jgi:hypothetical protein